VSEFDGPLGCNDCGEFHVDPDLKPLEIFLGGVALPGDPNEIKLFELSGIYL